jgi:hypothetical protein
VQTRPEINAHASPLVINDKAEKLAESRITPAKGLPLSSDAGSPLAQVDPPIEATQAKSQGEPIVALAVVFRAKSKG